MKTALIVDSSRLVRCVLKQMLSELGLQTVAEAADAPSGIDAFKQHKPDLVTLDTFLAQDSWQEAIKNMRSLDAAAKILVVTESAQGDVSKRAFELGAAAAVCKPVPIASLKEALDKLRPAAAPAVKKRCLIVDDSKMMRQMVRGLIEAEGLEVVGEAADVADGIMAFAKYKPDLVTLDLIMPGGSGADVLRNIIAQDAQAKVIMVTSVTQAQISAELSAGGAAAILNKPLTKEGLQAALKLALPKEPAAPVVKPLDILETLALSDIFRAGGALCVDRLAALTSSPWRLDAAAVQGDVSGDLAVAPPDLKDPVLVKITVGADAPVSSLLFFPREQTERAAGPLGVSLGDDAAELIASEWANILVTTVFNVIADKTGNAILVSPPGVVYPAAGEDARGSLGRAGEKAHLGGLVRLRFVSEASRLACELVIALSTDFARPLAAKLKPH